MTSVHSNPIPTLPSLARLGQSRSPVRCLLIELYRRDYRCAQNIRSLVMAIQHNACTPFFRSGEIDRLFTDEVLKSYAKGRYYNQKPLNNQDAWDDLVNNLFTSLIVNLDFLRTDRQREEEKKEILNDIRGTSRRVKIIEDWLYFHPEEQARILAFPQSA